MSKDMIQLDFGEFIFEAELFDCAVAKRFAENMPYVVDLQAWGNEVYGGIGVDLGVDSPVSEIPCGGIAYTNSGNYVCVFYGQRPAWAVEYIGQIVGDTWKVLLDNQSQKRLTIRKN